MPNAGNTLSMTPSAATLALRIFRFGARRSGYGVEPAIADRPPLLGKPKTQMPSALEFARGGGSATGAVPVLAGRLA